ncbi:MAG: SDR family NAD(P)-dependent oxidoreductase [Gammaproteobacteria bacterium]|nr:SDR family NAD(P)-dependent oxidoreductase [Gammaproteobacteria bacterium]
MADLKKAMVTGASEGMGRVFAQRMAARGYQVTLVARSEGKLQQLLVELGDGGHRYMVADLSTEAGMGAVADDIRSSQYELLINNAGISISGGFTDLTLEQQLAMVRLNCDSLTTLAYAFLQGAKAGDALLNVASIMGFFPYATQTVYGASKAYVISLTEGLWYEQKARGVFVMSVCPGPTATAFFDRAGIDGGPPKGITQTPEQVVEVALKALDKRGAPTHISGWFNKFLASLPRILTRKAAVQALAPKG